MGLYGNLAAVIFLINYLHNNVSARSCMHGFLCTGAELLERNQRRTGTLEDARWLFFLYSSAIHSILF